jgi:hypothetical protein
MKIKLPPLALLAAATLVLAVLACDFSASPTLGSEPGLNEWVEGHFWSINVKKAETRTSLNGNSPEEDVFVLVDVEWKAVDPTLKRRISGADFQLVDVDGNRYDISGMIYDGSTFEPFGSNAKYQPNKWVIADIVNDKPDTYRLVFDVPAGTKSLKLWFQDMPKIDLQLSLP